LSTFEGDSQTHSRPKACPVEIIKIKSKHSEIWSAASNGQDHSYTNDLAALPKRRGRAPKTASQQIAIAATETNIVNSEKSEIAAENVTALQDETVLNGTETGSCDDVVDDGSQNIIDEQQLALAAASLNADSGQVNQPYEVYGAIFPTGSELDSMSTVIKSEASLIDPDEDEERFLQEVLLKSVIGTVEQLSATAAVESDDSPLPPVDEKKRRGRPPGIVREKVIHMCEFKDCGKSFRRLREYINHYRTHTGDKPYVCDICGKKFVRSYAVTEHRRTHTGEKPYQCDICGKQFSVGTRATVQRFIKYTHTHPFNGPFSGTTCVSRYQKDKINLDFTEARDGEWQWHQLGHIKVSIQITTPAPHHSVFYGLGSLTAAQPTASKH